MPYLRYLPWVFCVWILVSGLLPESWVQHMEFGRSAVAEGQYWRLFSGQWVHFGVNHSVMNGLCLLLVQWQLLAQLKFGQWLWVQAWIQTAVGLGLLLLSHQVDIYRGYSGAFCGLLAYGLLLNLRRESWLMGLVYLGLLGKILLEQMPGYNLQYLQGVIGVAVATDAHLYGFISGTLAAAGRFLHYRCLTIKPSAS